MSRHRQDLPQLQSNRFVCYTGVDTDLLYNRGIELPGFASYPLLANTEHKNILRQYYCDLLVLAQQHQVGVILDSITWAANRDRGALLGYSPKELQSFNTDAIELMAEVRDELGDIPTVLSGQVGPRDDGYSPTHTMSIEEAEAYHDNQIATYASTSADMISGFTLCYAEEAAGIVRAAQKHAMPVAIAFTVETDGRLPTGMALKDAISFVDEHTQNYAAYFLINCAHPDHFKDSLNQQPWMQRLKGVIVNASRCSHAELETSVTLDDGNPIELGQQIGRIYRQFSQFNILGGCCGTDFRHIRHMLKSTT